MLVDFVKAKIFFLSVLEFSAYINFNKTFIMIYLHDRSNHIPFTVFRHSCKASNFIGPTNYVIEKIELQM